MKSPRVELILAMNLMEKVLSEHDPIKGNTWKEESVKDLWERVIEETLEASSLFAEAPNMIENCDDEYKKNFGRELIDIMNMCAMVLDQLGLLKSTDIETDFPVDFTPTNIRAMLDQLIIFWMEKRKEAELNEHLEIQKQAINYIEAYQLVRKNIFGTLYED